MSTPPWHPGSRDAPPVLCRWTRVSELLTLPQPPSPSPTPAVRVLGKGRRERSLPLWKQTADDLRAWVGVRGDVTAPELFLSAQGRVMTREELCLRTRKYVRLAAQRCPSLTAKQVTPHVLRPPRYDDLASDRGPPHSLALGGPRGYANNGSLSAPIPRTSWKRLKP